MIIFLALEAVTSGDTLASINWDCRVRKIKNITRSTGIFFIKDGSINKVYSLRFKVKVPTGMVEADLARPVIEVNNFENNKIDYEIYTFGDQTVVMPVKDEKERVSSLEKLAGERVSEEIKKIVPKF